MLTIKKMSLNKFPWWRNKTNFVRWNEYNGVDVSFSWLALLTHLYFASLVFVNKLVLRNLKNVNCLNKKRKLAKTLI